MVGTKLKSKPQREEPRGNRWENFLSITVPSLAQWFLLLVAALVLLIWFREGLLRLLGMGTVLLLLAAGTLFWVVWRRRFSLLWRSWNRWLGAIAFATVLLGLLAFFTPQGDILGGIEKGILHEVSLGGELGGAVIGNLNLLGALRLVGLVAVGIVLVAPHFAERFGLTSARRGLTILQQSLNLARRFILWLRPLYPWHLLRRTTSPVPEVEKAPPRNQVIIRTKGMGESRAIQRVPPTLPTPSPGGWRLPAIEFLERPAEIKLGQTEVERKTGLIEEALASYGVEAKVAQVNIGPTVTQFGVEPGWDHKYREVKERDKEGKAKVRLEEISRTRVKVERITSLDKDLALALAAPSIRIEAPVPGKPIVGIEVPNSSLVPVTLRGVMGSTTFQKLSAQSKLALALGEGAGGEAIVEDLAKMPHLLIAGATGSGKTVCLNSIIASLLMNNTPEELQFLLIDPKRVELAFFNPIPHLVSPVITENEKAIGILKWLNQEMDNRYRRLAQAGVRSIEMYNRSNEMERLLPRLILIIDELADLMMAKFGEVEPLLCRLAQMGRAIGIHLVIATQRPSVDVITGLIKANFPARISFAVASQVDSRTILDSAGAERLLGRGDMLYLPTEATRPKRLQGCFVSPQEIEKLVNFWGSQQQPQSAEPLAYIAGEESAYDPLLEEARRLAKEHKTVSASFLQRQLRIGYSRACHLMELIEEENTGRA